MRGWKPKDIEIEDYAEENLNNYFKQVKKVLENSKIPQSRQKSVLEDLKELLQEYVEEKRIKTITYAISLKLLELLGPPAEFAELAEEGSPPEIKTFEMKPSKIVEIKTSPQEITDIKKGTDAPKAKITPLMSSKDDFVLKPSSSTKRQKSQEVEKQAMSDGVLYKWMKKHILFLALLLPFCFGIIVNGLMTSNFSHDIRFWEDSASPLWSTYLFSFCFISAIGTYYVFSRKRANLSDIFLSGVLYSLFGLSQLGFLVVELLRYTPYRFPSFSNTISLLSLWSPIYVFVLLLFFEVFWSNRRKKMLVTNLSPQSQLRVKVHAPLLFFECVLLLFVQIYGSVVLSSPYIHNPESIGILWSLILLTIALECIFIGYICVESTLRSYFHDIKMYLQEYFGVKKNFLREYFSLEPVQESTSSKPNSIAPSLSNGHTRCSVCDRLIDLDWKFCPHCGFKNVPRVKKAYPKQQGKLERIRRHSLFLALLSSVIVAIYCFAAILVAFLNAESTPWLTYTESYFYFAPHWLFFQSIILFGGISTLGIYRAFFSKKSNASNFFLSGILYCILGISLSAFLFVMPAVYNNYLLPNPSTLIFLGFAVLSPFSLLSYYLFNAQRREVMQVTRISQKSCFILLIIGTVLFIGCIEIYFLQVGYLFVFRLFSMGYLGLISLILGISFVISAFLATRHSLNQNTPDTPEEYIEFFDRTSPVESEIQSPKSLESSSNLIKCPYCEQSIEANTIFCPYCAFEVVSFKEPKGWIQWIKRHKLFLALLLSVQVLMFANANLMYNYAFYFSNAAYSTASLFWIVGFIGAIFISGARVFQILSKKETNTIDFFLSGVLYTLFGIYMSIIGITFVFGALDLGSSIFLLFILSLSTPFAILTAYQLFKLFQRDRTVTMNLSRKHRLIIGGGTLLILLLGIFIVFSLFIGFISIILGIQQILIRPSDISSHQSTSFDLPTQLGSSIFQNE
ncbi:MAG: hypothetical protein ACFFCZ_25995 [Promethearchaeota archaeon]